MLSIIVAVSEDMGIGRGNDLLWNLPADMKRFKTLTMGKPVIMGRRTWESLPKRPLPGRRNIVITDIKGEKFDGAEAAHSPGEAAALCSDSSEAFVIGGGSIYRQLMPLAGRLYITHVHAKAPADVFFPEIDPAEWVEVSTEDHVSEDAGMVAYTYAIYERRH